ncbi:hypothetical protein CL629_02315 [bacterium]|nr:hypothetical protein [bacterium]|tara:strand:- start:2225 stop:2557 length:333 start_codon:yes stop_codon:yes gene_type:complete
MPYYKYRCKDCSYTVEVFQKMADMSAPEGCSKCNSDKKMGVVLFAPMVVLKGRGWAKDGYNYQKTPADTIPGYSDQDRQVMLPKVSRDAVPPKPILPSEEEVGCDGTGAE